MDAELKEKLMALAEHSGAFDKMNHVRIIDVDDGVGVVELEIHPESLNRWGIPHGGLLFTISDVACGLAAITVRPESCVTVNGSVDFINPGPTTGRLIATGYARKVGGKLSYCDSEIRDESGKLIATGRAVMCFTGTPML